MKVIFCLPGKQFSDKFLSCWSNLLSSCIKHGIDVVMSQKFNSNVYYVRAQCLGADVLRGRSQKPFNGQIEYDYIMWIDSDIVFQPMQFEQLIRRDLDIVGGMYLMESGTHFAAVKEWDVNHFRRHGSFQFLSKADIQGQTDPIEVAYTGFGFLLIKKGIFERISYPWFEPQMTDMGNGIFDFASEDVSFCIKARNAGFKIYVDPAVIVGHEKPKIVI